MTAHVHPLPVDAVALADTWFATLGTSFRGRLPPGDPLVPEGAAAWVVSTLGRELVVVVDAAFPYSAPKVHLRGERRAMAHVEGRGRLCLRNPAVPSDPQAAVAAALREARSLLRAITAGSEDGDFEEDFGLYWGHAADNGYRARLLLRDVDASRPIAWTAAGPAVYGFDTPGALRSWWSHRFGTDRTKVRQGALVILDELPHPDLYPSTGSELWELVASHSTGGTKLLEDLLGQTPKGLLVVLAGTAPSGRRHAVGLMLARPLEAGGRPVNRRLIERGYVRCSMPVDVHCTRLRVTRLATDALDASTSRLPYDERDRLAAGRVAVVGCGALGSGVARLLAKSGIGHIVLVDPETLGWENIRRHRLGAEYVGMPKATALGRTLARENPDIGSVRALDVTIEGLLARDPGVLAGVDLVLACTADWSANCALDEVATQAGRIPVLYAWMEAHALAAHAVLIMPGHSYRAGYDEAGNPGITASISDKPIPAECGASASPFGAVELAHAETLSARLAIDFLRGRTSQTTWWSWLTDAAALTDAGGRWTDDWVAARGIPGPLGQMQVGAWWEP